MTHKNKLRQHLSPTRIIALVFVGIIFLGTALLSVVLLAIPFVATSILGAILAGLLLPALNAAKNRAKAISCLGNMKQFGTIFMQYADANVAACPPIFIITGQSGFF